MPTRILFFAAHLQPFLLSGIKVLLQKYDVQILVYAERRESYHILDIPSDPRFRLCTYNDEPDTFFWNEIKGFNPQIVFCPGWMYFKFLSWCKALRKNGAKTICAMDTQWTGAFRQRLLTWLSAFTLMKCFSHAWVPGDRQLKYALKLGFDKSKVITHLYAPDTDLFQKAYDAFKQPSSVSFPKRFIYVGRMENHKMAALLAAFTTINREQLDGWELYLIGDGSMSGNHLINSHFVHYQKSLPQKQLVDIASKGGVFCLCSADEPWGTVVQEFSAAGMPLLVSSQSGSSDHFINGNGILCDGTNIESIKSGLLQFIAMTDVELFEMSEKSHLLGISTNSSVWAKELMHLT